MTTNSRKQIFKKPQSIFTCLQLSPNTNAISCEGLVCWASRDHPRGGDYVVICNPVTGEYASLSLSPMDEDNINVFIGMGFCKATKMFELLRMSGRLEDDYQISHWWPEVRTVGDRCWRRVGDGMCMSELDLLRRTISQVVYVKGAIYWSYSDYGDSTICSFHFDSAIFQVIPLPKVNQLMLETNSFASGNMRLGVLGNSLCVSLVSPDDGHVELLILENDGVSQVKWGKLYDVETKKTYLEQSGTKWPIGQYKAIKYLCHGEILMHDGSGKFIVYDPITKEETHFCVLQSSCLEDMRLDRFHDLQVVSHVPCLVKLKEALTTDEVAVKVMKEKVIGN